MRLVCPRCAAQYEVDESAIPESGRDVQCANCGDTWFQEPFSPAGEPAQEPQPTAEIADPPATEAATESASESATEAGEPVEPARAQQAKTDSSVLDILRREAELDAAARSGIPAPVEPGAGDEPAGEFELSATGAARRRRRLHLMTPEEEEAAANLAAEASAQTAEPRSEPEPAPPPRPASPPEPELTAAPKRKPETAPQATAQATGQATDGADDLPDVDSLNSTLRSADDSSRATTGGISAAASEAEPRGGRRGFSLALLIAVLLFATYALAPRIEAAFPASGSYLEQYVATIDLLRLRLADGVTSLVAALKGSGG